MSIRSAFIGFACLSVGLLSPAPAASAAQSQVFLIDLTITKDLTVTSNLIRLVTGETSVFTGLSSTFQARIVSLDGAILYATPIPVDFRVFDDLAITATDYTRLVFKTPYFLTAQALELLRDGAIFGRVDLARALCPAALDGQCSQFCALKKIDPDCFRCGNGVCELSESATSCPTDCSTTLTASPRSAPDFTPLVALVILALAGAGVAGWQYWRRR